MPTRANDDFTGFKIGSSNKLQIHNVTKVETQIHVIDSGNYVLNVFVHTKDKEDLFCLELFLDKNEIKRIKRLPDWFSSKVLELEEVVSANQS